MRIETMSRGLRVKVERTRRHIRVWEDIDGMHPIEESCVFVDKAGLGESIILILEGHTVPFGMDTSKKMMDIRQNEIIAAKQTKVPLKGISTKFGRWMARAFPWLIGIGIVVVIIFMVLLLFFPKVL